MNKRDLVDAVANKSELDRRSAESAIDAAVEAISGALADGDKVTLPGFGTFEVGERNARTGRNPQTGETIQIAASKAPAFKPASALKTAVNN